MIYLSICLCHLQFLSSGSYSFQSTGLSPPCVLVAQLCPTLCNPMDWSPPGVRGILQARTLEWVAISLGRFIPLYFILFDMTVNRIVSLLVYRNARDIFLLILYSTALPNSLMSSNSHSVYSIIFVWRHSSVQSLIHVWLFATPWTTARQASLSITNSWSPPKPMSIESVMPSNHLILCCPLLLLPSIFPSIKVFSNEPALHIRWLKYWSYSFKISPTNEHPGLISFSMDWLHLLAIQGTLKESSPTPQFKSISSLVLSFLYSPTHIHTWLLENP